MTDFFCHIRHTRTEYNIRCFNVQFATFLRHIIFVFISAVSAVTRTQLSMPIDVNQSWCVSKKIHSFRKHVHNSAIERLQQSNPIEHLWADFPTRKKQRSSTMPQIQHDEEGMQGTEK